MKGARLARRLLILALLTAVLAAGFPQCWAPSAHAVTQAEIDALKNQSKDLAGQRRELQSQLTAAAADKTRALEQKRLLEQQINIIQEEIDNLSEQIGKYNEFIAEKEAQVAQTQQEEAAQYALFCQRVRYMEEDGQVSYWAILFNSSDFNELLDRFMMVEEIMEYDNGVMNNLVALRQRLEEEKADLEETRVQLEAARAEQEAARAQLKSRQGEVSSLIAQISARQEELKKAEEELLAAAKKMDEEIARKERDLAAQLAKITSEAGFIWPIGNSARNFNCISSFFGPRTHPVTGKANNHTGIDIPVGGGTPILAAKSGVVLTATYNSSYGNYVVISHGGGQSTLYAHMRSKATVSEGDTVKQGQTVGYVGTTGSSTGNHLHFEIRLNGNRVDPLTYFKGSTLYGWHNGETKAIDWSKY